MTDFIRLENGSITGVINTALPSMKNGREIVYVRTREGRRPISKKSDPALAFVERMRDAYWEAISRRTIDAVQVPLEGRLKLEATIYYRSEASDVDPELLCDALQAAGLIKNDNMIREKHVVGEVDKWRPRVHFKVTNGK